MSDKNRRVIEQILKLEGELIASLGRKSNGSKEINIQAHRDKINKLKAQLK